MNKLSVEKRTHIIHLLVEGNSLRATARIAGIDFNTVLALLTKVGEACSEYQHMNLVKLPCKRIQIDEIWSFCYSKQKNIQRLKRPNKEAGDLWTYTSLCPDTKIAPSWLVGSRNAYTTGIFIRDLEYRMANRIQLTSDGYQPYEDAVNGVFGANVDYAMLVKHYDSRQRYVSSEKRVLFGNPKLENISTSLVERQNLNMRMSMRRFTRETNGFSKKVENHIAAVSLHFMYYNFARIHKTLRITPAMEAGIANHIWSIEEIVELVKEEKVKPRGAYKMKAINSMSL